MITIKLQIYPRSGSKYWHKNNELHRDHDLPAVIHPTGELFWYKDGLRHRDNGPAVTYPKGLKIWYHKGRRIEDRPQAPLDTNLPQR
jgi:hypothetical protein